MIPTMKNKEPNQALELTSPRADARGSLAQLER